MIFFTMVIIRKKRQNPYNPINIYITYTLINYSLIKQTKLNIYFCSTKTVTVIQKKNRKNNEKPKRKTEGE